MPPREQGFCNKWHSSSDGTLKLTSTSRDPSGVGGAGTGDRDGGGSKNFSWSAYGNFDIILDHLSPISQLLPTLHAAWAMLYFVPMLIGC